ncbi:autophagy protein 99 [Rozella allomycis CSF55]|uniref:Autophagy-related protein 9 n=1 Tax=Rozella allomycis (strain CSF55) TaxID=988480 RepID=A0A075B1K5_ROZAC|nr:Autophagy-related protein 9 domain-containing protein [Rozella allomycis CSF55]RKP21244.1 autophagy protein 99 [Rozella allomycis CSF55]|eukprot:EPZ34851.1 Autophagy-related protein 9 domain-containing protein [Rozella allomycis CSF55]
MSFDIQEMIKMSKFYNQVLGIDANQLLCLEWHEVTNKFIELQEEYEFTFHQMNAHDIANRIMRKENYFIALYNKDIIDIKLGENHKNFENLSARNYTEYSKMRFRDFNEMDHLFQRRLNESIPFAELYLSQFPNLLFDAIGRFLVFVSGTVTVTLALVGLAKEEILFLEIGSGRSLVWYLGVFGAILAVSRCLMANETLLVDTKELMSNIIDKIHFIPSSWKRNPGSYKVKKEFERLYSYRIQSLIYEVVGVLVVPYILYFKMSKCSSEIIDFFREFSVHIQGIGRVCSFAVFDFKRHGNSIYGHKVDKVMQSNDGKMEASFLNFKV